MVPYRRFVIAILGIVVCLASTLAQAPVPAVPASAEARLDQILNFWEQVTRQVTAFEAVCHRTRTSARFGTTEKYEGNLRLLKADPDLLYASLEMHRKEEGANFEKLILNDRGLWAYDSAAKVINLLELPKRVGIFDSTPIALVCGMKAVDVKKRFEIQLRGEDPNYFYLEISPRTAGDKANFVKIRLTLTRATYLPRQLWWQQPNQDEVLFDLPRVDARANHLRPGDFASPQPPPPGWRIALPQVPARKAP
ncbi:MAG TPA: TIGR03009 domain-containing protein [Gemmataceae bacterium]|jgi:TIGR03009 family protein|nr:TIGR03009 domain-containing protein [Gemmataceae bacterium]